ncbi:unnamed protein product, partial [Mesorhabditis belari]|uniref:Uncharacterized protein n=1 Tax=Mesorhabditis belari TaxID=2138241 RepID=A0AAF3END6_9BILA
MTDRKNPQMRRQAPRDANSDSGSNDDRKVVPLFNTSNASTKSSSSDTRDERKSSANLSDAITESLNQTMQEKSMHQGRRWTKYHIKRRRCNWFYSKESRPFLRYLLVRLPSLINLARKHTTSAHFRDTNAETMALPPPAFDWESAPVILDLVPRIDNMPTLVYDPTQPRRNFRLRAVANVNITIDGPYDQQGNDHGSDWTIHWTEYGNVASLQPGPGTRISLPPHTSDGAPQPGTYQLRIRTYLDGLLMQDLRVNLVLNLAVENTMAPKPMGTDDGPHGGGTGGGVGQGRLPPIETLSRNSNYCATPAPTASSQVKKRLNRLNKMSRF